MSILWADFPTASQGLYGSNVDLLANGLYAQVTGTLENDPDPTIGAQGRAFVSGSGVNTYLRRVLGGAYETVGMAFRVWLFGLPPTNGQAPYFQLTNGSNDVHTTMRINPDGTISVFKGPVDDTLIGTTAAPVIVSNAWQHIEWKTVDAVLGNVEIRVDGVTVFEFDGNMTVADSSLNQFRINSAGNTSGWAIKDIVAWNGLGSEANDFIGPCSVFYLPPNADVSSGWSRTTGTTDFGILDNVPPNDAQYIFAGEDPTIPAPSIVGCASLPEDVVAVRAVLPILRARKNDGGEGKVQMSLVSDGDEDPGADRAISTAFTYWWDVSHTDPATLGPWAPGAVDAIQLKINRTL